MHFWAAWCEPCAFLDTVLAQLAADAPAVAALRVEAEEAADISEAYGVAVVPLFLFFRDGQVADRLEGADAAALTAKFGALAAGAAPGASGGATAPAAVQPPAAVGGGGDLQAWLRQLVKQKPVMLFMKGSADAPRCGFSRKVVEALQVGGCGSGRVWGAGVQWLPVHGSCSGPPLDLLRSPFCRVAITNSRAVAPVVAGRP